MAGGLDLLGMLGGMGGAGTDQSLVGLSPRQIALYNHRADIYRPVRTYANDNKPGVERYELVAENVRCRFWRAQAVSNATVIGRIESDIAETIDRAVFGEDQEIGENYWVFDRTLDLSGDQANSYGRWFVCRGLETPYVRSARRQGGRKIIRLSSEKNAPKGIDE